MRHTERMACAVPAVTAAVGDLAEAVIDGVTGPHIPPRQPERLAEGPTALLADPVRQAGLGRAGPGWREARQGALRLGSDRGQHAGGLRPDDPPDPAARPAGLGTRATASRRAISGWHMGPLVVVGDALLDRDLDGLVERLSPEAPVPVIDDPRERCRPGGAALAAALAAADGEWQVVLVTALGTGARGRRLTELLDRTAVTVIDLGLEGDTPEKVRVRSDGRTLLRLDHGREPSPPGQLTSAARQALSGAGGVLVADYGRGLAAEPTVRRALGRLPAHVPVVWDPHPRGPAPVPGVRLATPNLAEAAAFAGRVPAAGTELGTAAASGRALVARWQAAGVAVTLGSRGVLLVEGEGPPRLLPPPLVAAGDPCGAGDRFASTAAGCLAAGALASEAVAAAVEAAAGFVAAGGAAGLELAADQPEPIRTVDRPSDAPTGLDQAKKLVAAVRRRRGTVVATGGCFDLLHSGHIATLSTARALGDCLIVCLNSDRSVRRLKGPTRPLVPERDRAAVLAALGCVDAVVVFDEPTPECVLDRLRPDVFAKGGDYALTDLPEAALLATWGGQGVILPYVAGRSTTRLLEEARRDEPELGTGTHASK